MPFGIGNSARNGCAKRAPRARTLDASGSFCWWRVSLPASAVVPMESIWSATTSFRSTRTDLIRLQISSPYAGRAIRPRDPRATIIGRGRCALRVRHKMGLRFTDTNKWRDPWFMDLSVTLKCLWNYVCDNCDNAGVWPVNVKLAEFEIGTAIDWRDARERFSGRVELLAEGKKWRLVKFLAFQYPGGLNNKNAPHRQVIRLLASHGLYEKEEVVVVDEGALRAPSEAPSGGAKTRPLPDQTIQGGVGGAKPDAGLLLAEFGLSNAPKDVAEWKGGLQTLAQCKSLDEARAFIRWAIGVCLAQGVKVEHFRHVRLLASEWSA